MQWLERPPNEAAGARPPAAPSIIRRIALTRKQWIGIPILAAIPVLTLLGVFGERAATTRASSRSLALVVRYPERFRYRQLQPLHVTIRNVSNRVLDTVWVWLDTSYVSRFSSVRIDPAPRSAFVVPLAMVAPGESRLVAAELWGEQYGVHHGLIMARSTSESVSVAIRTVVFP